MALSLVEHINTSNDSRSWKYKFAWINLIEDVLLKRAMNLSARKVLEVGAGVHNPLACSLLSIKRGAASATAVEPGRINEEHLIEALQVAMIDAFRSTGSDYRVQVIAKDVIARIERQDFGSSYSFSDVCLMNSDIRQIKTDVLYDVVHSIAVLEHITDLKQAFTALYDLSARGSIHIHQVDFVDHRFYEIGDEDPETPFLYIKNDDSQITECNGVRLAELIDILKDCGYDDISIEKKWMRDIPESLLDHLAPRYKNLERSDLETIGAIISFRKP